MQTDLLLHAVGELSHLATGDFAVDGMLRELCECAARVLGADGAGVVRLDEAGSRFVHAFGPSSVTAVEQLQVALGEGPCRDCMDTAETLTLADLVDDPRWPRYLPAALDARLRAVIAVPLRSRGRTWGAVTLYRHTAVPWSAEEVAAVQLLADLAVSYVVMAWDRDVARAAQQELAHQSMTDQLTGLPNRGLLYDRIEHALAVGRRSGRAVAAVFVDLDRFKRVNDTFGHAAGDTVLVEVCRRMTATLRTGDTLARLAGDEFVLLCENLPCDDPHELRRLLDVITGRLRAVLARPVHVDGADVVVTASMGIAVTTGTPTPEDLLHDADTAMYRAKERGRDCVVVQYDARPRALAGTVSSRPAATAPA